jgi:23S rRNA (cytosine1962-C5)-methyltransferase
VGFVTSTRERVEWAERVFRDFDPARVLYEDEDLIAVDKPAGVPCQAPSAQRPDDLPLRLRRFLAARRGGSADEVYLGTHQRLDQESSGVIVYTLRPSANPALARQFEARSLRKIYLAAVSGRPPRAGQELVHALAPGPDGRMRVAKGGKLAKTRVLDVRSFGDRSLVRVQIETGRTHQIRVQLAAEGCPIAGDRLYGGAPAFRTMLHAECLALEHPTESRTLEITAAPPLELEDWLEHGARSAYRDPNLLRAAIDHACQVRFEEGRALAAGQTTVFRLMHEAADGVPGFGVDVYDHWLVVRVRSDATSADESALLQGLGSLGVEGIYLKRHPKQANELTQTRDSELAPSVPVVGAAAPESLLVYEHGVPFEVRLHDGLRTGLFLDQRDNRHRIAELANGKRVLNLFAYTGSFSVAALAGGAASATTVDVSRAALHWAERNVARIGCADRHRVFADDAFDVLERAAQRNDLYDLTIVDPPSYATTKRGRFRVTKDYVALCRAALRVLSKDGLLLACINHYGISQDGLRRFVRTAVESEGLSVHSMRDTPSQIDFPLGAGAEPPTKSVLVRVSSSSARPAREAKRATGSRTSRDARRKHTRSRLGR